MDPRWLVVGVLILVLVNAQQDGEEDRGLHKKRRRPQYNQPCQGYGSFRDLPPTAEDGRSVKVVAALGGAAAGYYLGMKHQSQKPVVINNIINTQGGGGYPCGPSIGGGGGGGHLGGLGSHLSGLPILGSHLGGLSGPRYGGGWDRTIRQFNREVVRPLTRWF